MTIDYEDGSFPARLFRHREYPDDTTMTVYAIPYDGQFVVFPRCGFGSTDDVWILDEDELMDIYTPCYLKTGE